MVQLIAIVGFIWLCYWLAGFVTGRHKKNRAKEAKEQEEQQALYAKKLEDSKYFWSTGLPDAQREIIRLEILAQQTADIERRVEMLYRVTELKDWIERAKPYYTISY